MQIKQFFYKFNINFYYRMNSHSFCVSNLIEFFDILFLILFFVKLLLPLPLPLAFLILTLPLIVVLESLLRNSTSCKYFRFVHTFYPKVFTLYLIFMTKLIDHFLNGQIFALDFVDIYPFNILFKLNRAMDLDLFVRHYHICWINLFCFCSLKGTTQLFVRKFI